MDGPGLEPGTSKAQNAIGKFQTNLKFLATGTPDSHLSMRSSQITSQAADWYVTFACKASNHEILRPQNVEIP